jgi:lactoylglutathione lyase
MVANLAKQSLDVGLVTDDEARAVAFYHDLLGFRHEMDIPFPGVGVVKRFLCGDSVFRILVIEGEAKYRNSREGLISQTGLRYMTLTVSNLDELFAAIKAAGFPAISAPHLLRPGTRIAVVEDGQGVTIELMEHDR